jgi:hypothetical protein
MNSTLFDEEIFPDPDICFESFFDPPLPGLLRSGLELDDFCPEPPRKRIKFFITTPKPKHISFSLRAAADEHYHNTHVIAQILRKCDEILAQRHGPTTADTDANALAEDMDPLDLYDAMYSHSTL